MDINLDIFLTVIEDQILQVEFYSWSHSERCRILRCSVFCMEITVPDWNAVLSEVIFSIYTELKLFGFLFGCVFFF